MLILLIHDLTGCFQNRLAPAASSWFGQEHKGHETLVKMLRTPPSFKKGAIANHPVGVRMVELPQGNIIEERRGGAGILATLVNEMVKLKSSGYIRCERTPTEAMPRVGQVVVSNGSVSAAIHESDAILEGVDALIEIETDCLELDCVLQLIENVDIYRILDLHPTAKLNVEAPEKSKSSKWWQDISNHSNSWTKASKLPTIDASMDAPEFVKAKAAAMVHRHVQGGTLLKPGSVHSNEGELLFSLASTLRNHGRPLLVISRKTREDLVVNHSIPADDCLWLSQREGEGVQFVDIDAIKGTVYGFLEGNLRAVLLLEGLEYLANICGPKPVIDMVRELGDRMRFEDDCLLISCDKRAWSKSESAQLMRAAPHLEDEIINSWNSDPDALLDHPLMAPPTEEELLRLAEYLEANTPESFTLEAVEDEEETIEMESMPEPQEVPIEVAEEEIIITEEEEETTVEEEPVVESKGPRKPQRMKRRKAKHPAIMNDGDMRLAGLAAAKSDRVIGEIPSTDSLPKTVIGMGNEGQLPSIPNVIPTDLGDVVRQDSTTRIRKLPETKLGPKAVGKSPENSISQKKVISPLAARGVEIKRNVSKRSQASSVPQRKIDLDKELQSWKFEEGDEE